MVTPTLSPPPAPRRTWLDRLALSFPLVGGFALLLAVASPLLAIGWVHWDFRRTVRLLEERVGSLDPETLVQPPLPAEKNGAQALLKAGEALALSDDERATLGKIGPLPEPMTAFPPHVAAPLLASNERSFALARQALDHPGDDWGIDYRLGIKTPIPEYLPQLHLARLGLLKGLLALAAGDRDETLACAALLRRQADSLYTGGPVLQALIGRAVEALEHRLLARLVEDPALPRAELVELQGLLPAAELRQVWQEAVRRESSPYAAAPEDFAAAPELGSAIEPQGEASLRIDSWYGRLVVRYMQGGTLGWLAKASTVWESTPEEVRRSLELPPAETMGRLRQIRHILTPNFGDVVAKFRETDEARRLLTVGIALRRRQLEEGIPCSRAWGSIIPAPSAIAFEPLDDGGCRLRSLAIPELRRIFPPSENATMPVAEIRLPATGG